VVRPDGVFALMELSRKIIECTLHNHGDTEESVRLQPTVPWIMTEPELRLLPGQSIQTKIRLLSEAMSMGKNEGDLTLLTNGESGWSRATSAKFEVNLEAGGAIPEFIYYPEEFGWIFQGNEKIEFAVGVVAHGQGPMTGMVFLPDASEVADFQLEADDKDSHFKRAFVIESSSLPYREEGKIRVNIVTDSYLANHRFFQVELPYKFVFLKKSLPALAYGKVRQGLARTIRLEIQRSDGQDIDLEVVVPKSAAHYIEAYHARSGIYSFRLDTRELRPGTVINEIINLRDRSSGLQDQIKALAEVVSHSTEELATTSSR